MNLRNQWVFEKEVTPLVKLEVVKLSIKGTKFNKKFK